MGIGAAAGALDHTATAVEGRTRAGGGLCPRLVLWLLGRICRCARHRGHFGPACCSACCLIALGGPYDVRCPRAIVWRAQSAGALTEEEEGGTACRGCWVPLLPMMMEEEEEAYARTTQHVHLTLGADVHIIPLHTVHAHRDGPASKGGKGTAPRGRRALPLFFPLSAGRLPERGDSDARCSSSSSSSKRRRQRQPG